MDRDDVVALRALAARIVHPGGVAGSGPALARAHDAAPSCPARRVGPGLCSLLFGLRLHTPDVVVPALPPACGPAPRRRRPAGGEAGRRRPALAAPAVGSIRLRADRG